MDEKRKTKISRFLSLVLRHKPEEIGLTLEENGWIPVDKLIEACAGYGKKFSAAELREVPAGDYEIICLPLKIISETGDGAPARTILREL